MTCHSLFLPIHQLVISSEAIAVELMHLLMHLRNQRKDLIDQGLHRVPDAFCDNIESEDRACLAIHNGGDIDPTGSVLLVFFSPVCLLFLARLALQKV